MTDTGFEELDGEHVDPVTGEVLTEDEGPVYADTAEFVEEYIVPTFMWNGAENLNWCLDWWAHKEARDVFTAMHAAYEERVTDPPAMASWFRDVGYTLLDRMTGPRSPFAGCDHGHRGEPPKHKPNQALPVNPCPPGVFD